MVEERSFGQLHGSTVKTVRWQTEHTFGSACAAQFVGVVVAGVERNSGHNFGSACAAVAVLVVDVVRVIVVIGS